MHLTYQSTTLDLPDDLQWTDEDAFSPVRQVRKTGLTGKPIFHRGLMVKGRPIELVGARNRAWIYLPALTTLKAWRDIPGSEMTLSIRGASHTVVWDHERGAIQAEPVFFWAGDPIDTDPYVVTLRFLTV